MVLRIGGISAYLKLPGIFIRITGRFPAGLIAFQRHQLRQIFEAFLIIVVSPETVLHSGFSASNILRCGYKHAAGRTLAFDIEKIVAELPGVHIGDYVFSIPGFQAGLSRNYRRRQIMFLLYLYRIFEHPCNEITVGHLSAFFHQDNK